MNVNYPHDLVDFEQLRQKPKAERANYRPVPQEHVERLCDMSADERREWLKTNPLPPADIERILKAQEKRDRKAAKKQQEQA